MFRQDNSETNQRNAGHAEPAPKRFSAQFMKTHPFRSALYRPAFAALAAAALLSSASADENLFGYTYGAETLPKGKWEVYSWTTARIDRGEGEYLALDLKQEIEYGVTDRFQVSFYFNERYHDYSGGAIKDDGVAKNLNRFSYSGNQLALKYSVLSPYKDALGLAFYVEPGYSLVSGGSGSDVLEWELETKVILQKNFLEDQLITSLNVTTEFEWKQPRPSGGEPYEGEFVFEASGGVSYRVARNWYVGVEARYKTAFPDMNISNQESWAFSAGPAVHYGGERWWATLTWLPQIVGDAPGSTRSGRLDLEHNERNEIRLKVGYNF